MEELNRRLLLFAARTVAAARRASHPRVLGPMLLRAPWVLLRGLVRLILAVPLGLARMLGRVARRAYRAIDFQTFRRAAPFACAVAGAVLLIDADFSTVRKVTVLTVAKDHVRGGPEHFYALAVVGVLALPLAWGAAAGRSRPAMWALVLIGLAAMGVALGVDVPRLGDTEGLGALYDQAGGSAAAGFARELGGSLLLVAGGAALLRLTPRTRRRARRAGGGELAARPTPTASGV